jgi:hypothetical protein
MRSVREGPWNTVLLLDWAYANEGLGDPEDLVRVEAAAATQMKVPVISVPVQNAIRPDRPPTNHR